MLDPVNPKSCIKVAESFERLTELIARYLYANIKKENNYNVNAKQNQIVYKKKDSFSNNKEMIQV